MSVLALVEETDTILLQSPEKFDWDNPQIDPEKLEKDLIESMISHNGIGLAANQVGISLSVFDMVWDATPIVIFNPDLIELSKDKTYIKEGCLSYPGLYIAISRSESVKVQFDIKDGSTKGAVFNGMSSKIFQHEMEHIIGREYFWSVSNYTLKQALRKRKHNLRKIRKNGKV
jgi:peptide deformylase